MNLGKGIAAIVLTFGMSIAPAVLHAAQPSWLPSWQAVLHMDSLADARTGAAQLVRPIRGTDLARFDLGSGPSTHSAADELDITLGPTDFYCRATCPWRTGQISDSSALLATGTGWNRPLGIRLTLHF